jgi:sulfate/thiosulfate transport system substrate-binding protein
MSVIVKRRVFLRRFHRDLPLLFLAALLVYALWPWIPTRGGTAQPRTIVFYGFSILGEVMNQEVFPTFQEDWYQRTGERIEFITSFSGSGTITNQLIMGVPAQMALLSLELDAQRLADAGVTPPRSWHRLPQNGVVNRTPFIILVRPGNPKRIRDFKDLARPGIRIVHPDPMTSGGANWAIVAEFGAGVRQYPNTPDAGYGLLRGIWGNVAAQAASARAARTQFENGFGDALITYEQEVLWDKARGRLRGEIVYPRSTILSEHTLVKIERNIKPDERDLVDGLAEFLWSERAQRAFVEHGFRSIDDTLNESNPGFGKIQDPMSIADFGGWQRAKAEIVDAVWRDKVLRDLGK